MAEEIHISQFDKGLGDIISSLYAVNGYSIANNGPKITLYVRQYADWVNLFDIPNLTVLQIEHNGHRQYNYVLGDNDIEYSHKLRTNQTSKQWYANKLGSQPVKPELKKGVLGEEPLFPTPYVVFSPFASRTNRTWDVAHWRKLGQMFKEVGFEVICLDSPSQALRCKGIGTRYYWGQSASWVANVCHHAALVISNDSGIAHFGGAIDCKTLVIMSQLDPGQLYGHTNNHIITPTYQCTGCRFQAQRGYHNTCNFYCAALSSITPQLVFKKALQILPGYKPTQNLPKQRLLALVEVGIGTGFSRVSEEILSELAKQYEVQAMGINLRHNTPLPTLPFKVIKAEYTPGDNYGLNTIPGIVRSFKPHKVLAINDAPVCEKLLRPVVQTITEARLPMPQVVSYCPIDGEIFNTGPYKYLLSMGQLATYTHYGVEQLKIALGKESYDLEDIEQKVTIVRHSINSSDFFPADTIEARDNLNLFLASNLERNGAIRLPENAFVVGWLNRNQPRKNLVAAIHAFAKFQQDKPEAHFLIKATPYDYGGNFIPLLKYYGILDKTIVIHEMSYDTQFQRTLYNAIDIFLSTSVAEGWGLTEHEAAACGKPLVLPNNTVRPELWEDAAHLVTASVPIYNPAMCMSIGWLCDIDEVVEKLNFLFHDPEARLEAGEKAMARALEFGTWADNAAIIDNCLNEKQYTTV